MPFVTNHFMVRWLSHKIRINLRDFNSFAYVYQNANVCKHPFSMIYRILSDYSNRCLFLFIYKIQRGGKNIHLHSHKCFAFEFFSILILIYSAINFFLMSSPKLMAQQKMGNKNRTEPREKNDT